MDSACSWSAAICQSCQQSLVGKAQVAVVDFANQQLPSLTIDGEIDLPSLEEKVKDPAPVKAPKVLSIDLLLRKFPSRPTKGRERQLKSHKCSLKH